MLIEQQLTLNAMVVEARWSRFGTWLKKQRELAEVTQTRLADEVGLHVIHLSRIENNHVGTKRETIERLVSAINKFSKGHKVDLNEAFAKAGFAPDAPVRFDPEGIYHDLDKVPEEFRELAKKQVKGVLATYVDQAALDTNYIEDDEDEE